MIFIGKKVSVIRMNTEGESSSKLWCLDEKFKQTKSDELHGTELGED